ncbi:IclR family transcriptional regulator [Streptomyces chartreusis]|uniref:IclR family transcriptional regulator n=1 Tax=Streptomyces chartreusis TaxID=1969 RepID=UPI00367608FB
MPDVATVTSPNAEEPRRALGTVTRAGRALDLFTPARPVWGASALARELGVAKSQAHELLVSLDKIGLLRRESGGRYRLGWRTLALGRDMLRSQFPDDALRLLRVLAMRFNEPVMLMAMDRDRPTIVLRHGSSADTDPLLPETMGRYSHCCAMVKCLVAERGEAERRALLRPEPERFTATTVVKVDEIFRELDAVQRNRIAFDRGEIHPDLRAVAAPISDGDGVTIAAVGLWTTAARWEGASTELTSAVIGTGRRIETALRTAGRATEGSPIRTQGYSAK